MTSSSNFASVSQPPPKAYEEMIQKLESDVRAHIRVEQQMKIAMEGLQQKLEDKEREKKQAKAEYKQYINELKQDKKRYVQLLELRDKEVERLEERVRILQEAEAKNSQKLARLDMEIEKYK